MSTTCGHRIPATREEPVQTPVRPLRSRRRPSRSNGRAGHPLTWKTVVKRALAVAGQARPILPGTARLILYWWPCRGLSTRNFGLVRPQLAPSPNWPLHLTSLCAAGTAQPRAGSAVVPRGLSGTIGHRQPARRDLDRRRRPVQHAHHRGVSPPTRPSGGLTGFSLLGVGRLLSLPCSPLPAIRAGAPVVPGWSIPRARYRRVCPVHDLWLITSCASDGRWPHSGVRRRACGLDHPGGTGSPMGNRAVVTGLDKRLLTP